MPRVPVNGVMLNVTEIAARQPRRAEASAIPIVMVHGLAASSAFWYAAGAPFLSLVGPILLYDLRGHGRSDAPDTGYGVVQMASDLEALLAERGIGQAHIVAHSFGGMIALLFALKHPERVASLVLADVRVRSIQHSLQLPAHRVSPAMGRRLAELGIDLDSEPHEGEGINHLKTVARIQIAAPDEASEILDALYHHPRLFRSPRNAERWIRLVERASLVSDIVGEETFEPDDLRRLDLPMLVLVGAMSTTRPSARALVRLCPNAMLREVPGVGHFFPAAHPRKFLLPTLRFLRMVNRRGDEAIERIARHRKAIEDRLRGPAP